MKKEIKEAAEKYANMHQDVSANLGKHLVKGVFEDGAEWQQERMYSEEEVYSLLEQSMKDCHLWELEEHYSGDYKNLKEWFEQYKKK